jgi:hypothetical protein
MRKNDRNHFSEDAEYVVRCLEGDLTGFEVLVERHGERLKRLLCAMLSDPYEVDDVYQEALIRAYLNIDQLREPDRFGSWVYSIAVNLARTRRLNNAWPLISSLDELKSEVLEEEISQNHSLLSSEMHLVLLEEARRVQQAIADLPKAEREAVMLVYLDGMSQKEAAAQLGASLSAVKVRVHRGRRHLRAAFIDRVEPASAKPILEVEMIEVKIHDILLHVTEEEPEIAFQQSDELKKILSRMGRGGQYVVLLRQENGERALPIWIGPFEAEAIVIVLKQVQCARPITFDLMKTLLDTGGIHAERVDIHRLHETVFYANLIVRTEQGTTEIDCRPSDALNLAVRLEVPIFVAGEIMEALGQTPSEDGTYPMNPDKPEIVWQSLLLETSS